MPEYMANHAYVLRVFNIIFITYTSCITTLIYKNQIYKLCNIETTWGSQQNATTESYYDLRGTWWTVESSRDGYAAHKDFLKTPLWWKTTTEHITSTPQPSCLLHGFGSG